MYVRLSRWKRHPNKHRHLECLELHENPFSYKAESCMRILCHKKELACAVESTLLCQRASPQMSEILLAECLWWTQKSASPLMRLPLICGTCLLLVAAADPALQCASLQSFSELTLCCLLEHPRFRILPMHKHLFLSSYTVVMPWAYN